MSTMITIILDALSDDMLDALAAGREAEAINLAHLATSILVASQEAAHATS